MLRNGEPVVMRVDDPDDVSALRALHLAGANDDLLIGHEIKLQSRARGYSSDEAVWDAVRRGEPVAIATALAVTGGGFGGPGEDAWRLPDSVDFQATVMPEVMIRVSNGARFADLQVIAVVDIAVGILDVGESDLGQLPTVLVSEGIWAGLYDDAEFTRHLVAVRDGADSRETAQAIERALAIEAVDIQGDLEQEREQTSSFFLLFQAFIGLGLVAGLGGAGGDRRARGGRASAADRRAACDRLSVADGRTGADDRDGLHRLPRHRAGHRAGARPGLEAVRRGYVRFGCEHVYPAGHDPADHLRVVRGVAAVDIFPGASSNADSGR